MCDYWCRYASISLVVLEIHSGYSFRLLRTQVLNCQSAVRAVEVEMFLRILLVALCSLSVVADHPHDKILVAFDIFPGRAPTPAIQKGSSQLLEYRMLQNTDSIPANVDVATGAEWTQFFRILDQTQEPFHKTYFGNARSLINMFEDKAQWKDWMTTIGLGTYIPQPIPYNGAQDCYEFPLILKTEWLEHRHNGPEGRTAAVHAGAGVHIIHTPEHLHTLAQRMASPSFWRSR